MKKLVCAVLALLLVFAPGCAKDADPDILSGYNVVRYDERDSFSAQDCLRSILVLTEEEALSCGEQVKDFLESASLVYVLSSKSSSELARAAYHFPSAAMTKAPEKSQRPLRRVWMEPTSFATSAPYSSRRLWPRSLYRRKRKYTTVLPRS